MHILILITLIALIALPAAVRSRRAPARAPVSSPRHPPAVIVAISDILLWNKWNKNCPWNILPYSCSDCK